MHHYGENPNVIDARFIDTKFGVYVDITALAYGNTDINHLSEPRLARMTIDGDESLKSKTLSKKQKKAVIHPRNYVSDKSPHFYTRDQLFPLRLTKLDGIPVWRPNDVVSILGREYGERVMVKRAFSHYIFDDRPHVDDWVEFIEWRKDHKRIKKMILKEERLILQEGGEGGGDDKQEDEVEEEGDDEMDDIENDGVVVAFEEEGNGNNDEGIVVKKDVK
ncbi:hypothetical protein HDU76_009990 [Blyttiomyces sp. JEL0837]|nr:hypothetical protein HDU76_009990 [Blyttiomyces sp. JEL0837]